MLSQKHGLTCRTWIFTMSLCLDILINISANYVIKGIYDAVRILIQNLEMDHYICQFAIWTSSKVEVENLSQLYLPDQCGPSTWRNAAVS